MTRKSISKYLWYTLLILLPFSSLPLAGKILRSSMVAAPSILPLFLLSLIWIIPIFFKGKIKETSFPVLLFFVFSVLSTIISLFFNIPIEKTFNPFESIAVAYVTLIIGIAFFVFPLHFLESSEQLSKSVRIISITFIPIFFWSVLQFVFGLIPDGFPDWMYFLQKQFSTSGLFYTGRITGFAFEPSWLAHQLNILYLPLFLGASLSRYSFFKKKFFKLKVENLFLIGAVFLLFLTKSRIGWISFIFCLFYVLIIVFKRFTKKLRSRYLILRQRIYDFIIPLSFVIVVFVVIITGLFISSKIDPRMEKVLDIEIYQNKDFISVANDFLFAERILYWEAGWEMFNDHPFLGVGLGNYGFYFEEYMPAFASVLDEPREILFRANYLANNKNLWTRLLSETGIVGFIIFTSWLIILWVQGSQLVKNKNHSGNFWGHVMRISLIALVFEGFSIDSFALPYFWTILGICSASYYIFNNENMNLSD